MRTPTVFALTALTVAFGCFPETEEPASPPPEVSGPGAEAGDPSTDLSLSIEVGDDGGSLETKAGDGATSVDAKLDIDVDADSTRKKKRQE